MRKIGNKGVVWHKSPNNKNCNGLMFRGFASTYLQNDTFCEKKGLRLLKRLSCKCPSCKGLMSCFKEHLSEGGYLINSENIEHGKAYSIRAIEIELYDGHVDDCEFEVFEINEVWL